MRTSDFFYRLPPELIAQRPVRPRDSSLLLVFNRNTNETIHQEFHELIEFLSPKDVLVLNETKVMPARLHATKIPSGGAVEILLLERIHERTWDVIIGGRGVGEETRLKIRGGPEAMVIKDYGKAKRQIEFSEPILKTLESIGEMPTPPYIHTPVEKDDEYQTIYASDPGSAAAPTAGLHFTQRLLDQIQAAGTQIAKVTLHVGLDTFAPVQEEAPKDHEIHQEWCRVSDESARRINQVISTGGRVIAVGTTSVRTLETAWAGNSSSQQISPYEGYTSLFILPGYSFKVVNTIITNFHLPESTLLMMISAFTGRETLLKLYETAISLQYRFYSFGDAMLIL